MERYTFIARTADRKELRHIFRLAVTGYVCMKSWMLPISIHQDLAGEAASPRAVVLRRASRIITLF